MTESIMTLIFGALVCVLGIINMTGNVSSLHSYHRKRVREEDRKPFGRLVGLGTLLVGASLIAESVFSMIYASTQIAAYEIVGSVILIAGMITGIIITFIAMIKYNKGIF